MRVKKCFLYFIYLMEKHGLLGRRKKVEWCLSLERNGGFIVNKEKKQQFYSYVRKNYNEIRLHKLWSTRIGEYLARYLNAVEDSQRNANQGILDVFVLTNCVTHNKRLTKIMGRNLHIIDDTNADIWEYILTRFPKVDFFGFWDSYWLRERDRIFSSVDTVNYFRLTKDEEKEGMQKKKLMGLNNTFVCVTSRDSSYLSCENIDNDTNYCDYRDSDINCFSSTAEYLKNVEITMVRMGKYVKNTINFDNCIDYANVYYDEFMDIYLMKKCKFFVGDSSGMAMLAMSLNKPVIVKNVIPVFMADWGSHPRNSQNIIILKKYYSKVEKRYLSLREIMALEKRAIRHSKGLSSWYEEVEKKGIIFEENSPEEILEVVKEMNLRIDGDWVETEEDINLQNKYHSIYEECCKQAHLKMTEIPYARIGAFFIRKNRFLLD